ncbi:MAG: TIGR00730 family Rossman fold protein [Bacteroidaceae bacterium]|nr:TIGR00730 family Rossman fold protein [Bacteroidaceae bacterium]
MDRKKIVVYGASSPRVEKVFSDAAYLLGSLMATSGRTIITGGGVSGLMAAVEEGSLRSGGYVIGIIPKFMVENGWMYEGLSEVIRTDDMHQRKELMAGMADAVVALPGGTGTLEELLEIITWKMLGLFSKPVVILNTDGYYDPLLLLLDRAVERNFMNKAFLSAWEVAMTPEQVMEIIESSPEWVCPVDKYN